MHTQWSNNHTILVVLQAKYEQMQTPPSTINTFFKNLLRNIKHFPSNKVKHCDSLICELDLEYIMCPTDPNFYKGLCAQKEWDRKCSNISAGAIDPHEDCQKNFKKFYI